LENFLLTPGVNFAEEVLGTEKLLISKGLVPSVFFRFPGLVANQEKMAQLSEWGLVAVGADAWIGKGQKPHPGSIVLLHGNGNEPKGLELFTRIYERAEIAFPFRHLLSFAP
jgi:hypothetical protein